MQCAIECQLLDTSSKLCFWICQVFWLATKGIGYLLLPQPPKSRGSAHPTQSLEAPNSRVPILGEYHQLRLMPVAKEAFHAWQGIASVFYDKDASVVVACIAVAWV